jgi:type IV secretory pathway VirB10-like protein
MDKPKSEIKVTDKRIFTAEGEIREEFRQEIKAGDPFATKPAEQPAAPKEAPAERRQTPNPQPPASGERRNKSIADKAQNPGTPFADFVEPLIAQAYVSLGMLRDPYGQKPKVDAAAARQMIEMITMLKEKTAGNLTQEEDDFLSTHLGELKLAFVQRTKSLT